jgi:hypothetical protein
MTMLALQNTVALQVVVNTLMLIVMMATLVPKTVVTRKPDVHILLSSVKITMLVQLKNAVLNGDVSTLMLTAAI